MTRALNALLYSALCIALPACAQTSADTATEARLGERQLTLEEHDGRCALVEPGQADLDLQLKWPCQFHRDREGGLRTLQVGENRVLLVESSEKVPDSQDCRTEIQAVRTLGTGLEPSEAVSRVAACPPIQWDDKVFIGLFESRP
ncbi:hypothetical protein BZL41_14045 [Pseudomonas sp. PIC25]|uniref:hypothetical protein n=1 Tax=Pseudomonas sp. PIC25 TaxID=1958773 RepID=UPI000BAB7E06|nr:hypothetical protein [Pseudomonas sp. PIC25]PAU61568.1 hypothetical protein BZL41_14045 [Pseudomonas sp. PIC25]